MMIDPLEQHFKQRVLRQLMWLMFGTLGSGLVLGTFLTVFVYMHDWLFVILTGFVTVLTYVSIVVAYMQRLIDMSKEEVTKLAEEE